MRLSAIVSRRLTLLDISDKPLPSKQNPLAHSATAGWACRPFGKHAAHAIFRRKEDPRYAVESLDTDLGESFERWTDCGQCLQVCAPDLLSLGTLIETALPRSLLFETLAQNEILANGTVLLATLRIRETCRRESRRGWLRGVDLNHRPLGYEPNELPDCSTPRFDDSNRAMQRQTCELSLLQFGPRASIHDLRWINGSAVNLFFENPTIFAD